MRPLDRRESPSQRGCRPSLERLEVRDLPSAVPPLAHAGLHSTPAYLDLVPTIEERRAARASAGAIHSLADSGQAQRQPNQVDPSLLPAILNAMYGPVTAPNGQVFPVPQPTPAEIRRETFVSQFVGTYYIGPPRTTDRGPTIRIFSHGNNAGSNQFLKGRAQILILPPANPNAKPDLATNPIAGMVVGLASYITTNFLQNSGNLMFDITNIPGVASNDPSALSHGLPSRLSWTLDLEGAGVYTQPTYMFDTFTSGLAPGGAGGATAWTQGAGFVDLKYFPDRHPKPGTIGSGKVIVKFQGLFNNPGILNAIAKGFN